MYIFFKKRHRPPVFKQTEGQYIFILYPYISQWLEIIISCLSLIIECFALLCKALVTGPDNKRNGDIYNMNGTFFLEDLLLSLKYEMIGFLIPIVSRSASLREENFLPVSPFLCKWFTILSSTPIWRKKVIISSVLKDDKFPSFGIVISFSGINLETAEN